MQVISSHRPTLRALCPESWDYTYFLAGYAKAVLGVLFLFGVLWEDSYPLQMAASGVISLITAALVWRDSRRTLQLYLRASGGARDRSEP